MACELLQREFQVGEDKTVLVGVRQWAASKALENHVELVQYFGNACFAFIENKYNFADILVLMKSNNSSPDIANFIKRIVSTATIDGKEVNTKTFDMFYQDNLMLAFKVFGFVLEANFFDFFKQGLQLTEQRKLEAEEASKLEEQKNQTQG